jgi:hypothetical protein
MTTASWHTEEGRIAISLNALPPIARRKFEALQALVRDAGALVKSSLEREHLLELRLFDLQRRLRLLNPKIDADLIKDLGREHAEIRAEVHRARDERMARNSVRGNADQIISQLKCNFLAADNVIGPWGVHAYEGRVQLRDGESLPDAIQRVRSELQRTQGQLAAVKAAPPARAEVEAALVAEINRWAAEGAPKISLDGGKVSIAWPDVQLYALPGSELSAPSGSASKLICFLFRAEMLKRVTASVANIDGITAAERKQQVAELEVRLARQEHEEEQLIEMALAAGVECHRRPAASPYALLGIERNPEAVRAQPAE